MNCLEAQKRIRPFLQETLPDRELTQFLEHVENCSTCYDELVTYYAIYRTIQPSGAKDKKDRQEKDDGNYQAMLEALLTRKHRYLQVRSISAFWRRFAIVVAECISALAMLTALGVVQIR